jgi:hypothetical protein
MFRYQTAPHCTCSTRDVLVVYDASKHPLLNLTHLLQSYEPFLKVGFLYGSLVHDEIYKVTGLVERRERSPQVPLC